MNAPMRTITDKEIGAKIGGVQLPIKLKKHLIGSEVVWFDKNPLSQDFGEALHYYFDCKITRITAMLLAKHGLIDVSQTINVPLHWGVEMDLVYSMPNRKEGEKVHTEPHYFEFFGTMYPMNNKFIKERDQFFLLKNMEFLQVPDDQKNKKFFETTKFRAVVIGC